jgi:hypothetical protein
VIQCRSIDQQTSLMCSPSPQSPSIHSPCISLNSITTISSLSFHKYSQDSRSSSFCSVHFISVMQTHHWGEIGPHSSAR